jgi:hypothetical protein
MDWLDGCCWGLPPESWNSKTIAGVIFFGEAFSFGRGGVTEGAAALFPAEDADVFVVATDADIWKRKGLYILTITTIAFLLLLSDDQR